MLNNVRDPCIVADGRIVLSDMVKHRHGQPKTFLHCIPASLPVCAVCLACWFLLAAVMLRRLIMPATLKEFQETLCAGIVARFNRVRHLYEQLAGAPPEQWTQARCNDAVTVLCAPTSAGKTLIAVETMRRVSATGERVLWFWFAPFSGLVEQSRQVIAAQAPELDVFDLQSDRCWETVRGGGVFVVTWAAVAVRNTEGRRARTHGDSGMSLDVLLALACEEGVRIGCVVDEAHHTALSGHQARLFFSLFWRQITPC